MLLNGFAMDRLFVDVRATSEAFAASTGRSHLLPDGSTDFDFDVSTIEDEAPLAETVVAPPRRLAEPLAKAEVATPWRLEAPRTPQTLATPTTPQ